MNYRSKSVPVDGWQLMKLPMDKFRKYIEKYLPEGTDPNDDEPIWRYRLKQEYGSTDVEIDDWIVEFINGEVHVVRPDRWIERFEAVESYTPEDVRNAVSMAKRWHEMGGESS